MAKRATKKTASKKTTTRKTKPKRSLRARLRRWVWRGVFAFLALVAICLFAYKFINPPGGFYMLSEARRLGDIDRQWAPMEEIAPVMARSVVAAEDANFCLHWGLDVNAIRDAMESGGTRGASTISQQVVKNVYLWHGRSWLRKSLEALLTPAVEAVWTKRRIIEVYLNVAEFDEGVFGIDAAAYHYFKTRPSELTATQAARLAAILPNPKGRSASNPSSFVRKRAASIVDGAATIKADGRAACFES